MIWYQFRIHVCDVERKSKDFSALEVSHGAFGPDTFGCFDRLEVSICRHVGLDSSAAPLSTCRRQGTEGRIVDIRIRSSGMQ